MAFERQRTLPIVLLAGLAALSTTNWTFGQIATEPSNAHAAVGELRQEIVAKGVRFLTSVGQAEDGSFSKVAEPGVTALCVTALQRSGLPPTDRAVQRGLKYLETFIQEDGGIYRKDSFYQNYETCISMMAFHEANDDGQYSDVLARAATFARALQWDEKEGKDPSDPAYGGAGYGNSKRPDLSNTQFFIEALKSQEDPENREAIERALIFVSRTQNLESEHNTLPVVRKNPDGGFYYTPVGNGFSQAGELESGGLRSYGSMTYAGLKSMIFAGVGPTDPRVVAATRWLRRNYTLEENPGIGSSGLYYYYHTFAKALHAVGEPQITDENGVAHDWRQELIEKLAEAQQADGSWINANPRWMEGDPNLVTAYALLALSYCDERPPSGGGEAPKTEP